MRHARHAAAFLLGGAVAFLGASPAAIVTAMVRFSLDDDPQQVVQVAQKFADELARRGRLGGRVRIESASDLGSTGTAAYDFVVDECSVRIDASAAKTHYADRASFRFLVYHELAHCEFYRRPGGLFRRDGLSMVQARLLDDIVVLDALDADVPDDRLNLYPIAHETYADLRAAALLLEEGVDQQAVRRIAAMRAETAFDRYHATEHMLARLLALPPAQRTGAHLEPAVRALTGERLLAVGIWPMLRPVATIPFAFQRLLENRVGSIQGRIASGQGEWMAYLGNVDAPAARLDAYPHLAWAFGNRARAEADPRQIYIDAWLGDVYGDLPARAAAANLATALGRLIERRDTRHAQ